MPYQSSTDIITIRDNARNISFFEYFYVLVLILYAANANQLVLVKTFEEDFVVVFIPIILSAILFLKFNVLINRSFYLLILCFFIYFVAITIKYYEFHPTIFVDYFFKFFIVYVTIKTLKFDFFKIYERILYYLAIIGLLMWGIQIILGGDTLYSLFRSIPSIDKFSHVTGDGLNAIIYSVQPASASILFNYLPPRNCGFAWEPGGFAVYLCLAVFINLFINNSDRKSKNRLIVLLLALISTQSTTGFVILIIIIFFYYWNKKIKTIILVLPVLVIAVVLLFSLPFMSEKIISLANETKNIDIIIEQGYMRETSIAPQRFSSFVIALRDFSENPILGTGGIGGKRWIDSIRVNISTISGIGYLLVNYGIIGLIFFLIMAYKSSSFFSKCFNYKGKLLFFLIILSISISYPILEMPLIMSFWLFSFFETLNSHRSTLNLKT